MCSEQLFFNWTWHCETFRSNDTCHFSNSHYWDIVSYNVFEYFLWDTLYSLLSTVACSHFLSFFLILWSGENFFCFIFQSINDLFSCVKCNIQPIYCDPCQLLFLICKISTRLLFHIFWYTSPSFLLKCTKISFSLCMKLVNLLVLRCL